MNPVKAAIGRKMNLPVSMDEEEQDLIGEDSEESQPYSDLARAGAPVDDGGMGLESEAPTQDVASVDQLALLDHQTQSAQQGAQEQAYSANMGQALSNLSRGMNAPTDQSSFYQGMAKQGQDQAALSMKGIDRKAQVIRAMQDRAAKVKAAEATRIADDLRWDKRNKIESSQKDARAQTLAGIRAKEKADEQKPEEAKQEGLYNMGSLASSQYAEATADPKVYDPTSTDKRNVLEFLPMTPDLAKRPQALRAHRAQSVWVENFLRDASGAAIPASERMEYAADFFPRPGDSPEVVANKAASRAQKEKNALMRSGKKGQSRHEDALTVPQGSAPQDDDAALKRLNELRAKHRGKNASH